MWSSCRGRPWPAAWGPPRPDKSACPVCRRLEREDARLAPDLLAALGFATTVFAHVGGEDALNFIIPILLFIFVVALGEDYNILLMARVREEARSHPLREAVTRAVGRTSGTITSAGVILAGALTVLAIAGNSDQARKLGFTIAFLVRGSTVRPR